MKQKLTTTVIIIAVLLGIATNGMAQTRKEVNLSNWLFSRDGNSWQPVTIPHDWAISGPFDKQWDLQYVAIEQNGETIPTEKSGRSGALPWIGRGIYRTTFQVPASYQHAELLFDGAMAEPEVYVNGQLAGYWAYGYNSFRVDVAPFLRPNGGANELEVRLQNLEESSRWYPGAGLYRPVTLTLTANRTRIDPWGTYIRTLTLNEERAVVKADMLVTDIDGTQGLRLLTTVYDANGIRCAESDDEVPADGRLQLEYTIGQPRPWSPESPNLYRVESRLLRNDQAIDTHTQSFGIRTVSVSRDGGFCLNGQSRKLKGVCLHHDLGPLGAAVSKSALIRQIRLMKDMGADAIRTAHNMPSQLQMEVCDSMGMMVMAESFDMWRYPKCRNGYARLFDEWSERDITHLLLAHRNHPSIIMWSIGNEIPEQWSPEGVGIARRLQELCHQLDPFRPVTQGMDRPDEALASGFAQVMDVPGFNYRVHKYADNIARLPQGFLLGSETASTVSSRGVYKFPVVPCAADAAPTQSPDTSTDESAGQCSSYDVEYCSWSNLPDDDWAWQDDAPWVIGEFVWTGFDYLGEPTPYDSYWPARSSYFGICDLAGLPKDRYFLYRSHWNREQHTLHLLPHWTWPGREGELTPVYCYTDYPEAELFVNGRSQGRLRKHKPASQPLNTPSPRYRLCWNNVRYAPGELRVVAYDANGRRAAEHIVRTAGAPHHLQATAETFDESDGLIFVTLSQLDRQGNLCPHASTELTFSVGGSARFKAACNGDATSLQPFTEPHMRLFHGQLVVIIERTGSGPITLQTGGQEFNL